MEDLGDLVEEYKGTPWRNVVAALISAAMAIAAVWAIREMKPSDPSKAWLIVLLFGIIAAVFVALAMRDSASRLSLHARGLVYERGARRTTIEYAQVARVNEYRVNGKAAALLIQMRDGKEIKIAANLDGYHQAASIIAAAV
jgi:hypothetical protein